MRWQGRDGSEDVEDGGSGGGGARGLGIGGGIIGIVGFVIYLFTGYNPTQLLDQVGVGSQQQQTTQSVQQPLSPEDSVNVKFSRVIMTDTKIVWTKIFNDMGQTYEKPTLVHFKNEVDASGCGMASSATGPFYCPADRKVYLDFPFLMQVFFTTIVPFSIILYSAVVQLQAFSKRWGKAAISYHLPKYLLISTFLTVSNGLSCVFTAKVARPTSKEAVRISFFIP